MRRTGLPLTADRIASTLAKGPADAVDDIIDEALHAPLPDPPAWRNDVPPPPDASDEEKNEFNQRDRGSQRRYQADWIRRLHAGGLRENLAFFWHNHFVTELFAYRRGAFAYRYVDCLRRNALGNFREFVREIGLNPAMLIYLDGRSNTRYSPNENYARELLELFTTGLDNYTERDVKEIARSITGWRVGPLESYFSPGRHDSGLKTIFGRTGNFGYDDAIDLIFLERRDEIARFVAEKLYRHFVYEEPDEETIGHIAAEFSRSEFDLAVPVRSILRSNAFFDAGVAGGRLKSPVEFFVSLVRDFGIDVTTWTIRGFDIFWFGRILVQQLGQDVLNPPDVSGWPGHHDWISSSSLTSRWNVIFDYIRYADADAILSRVSNPNDAYVIASELSELLLGFPQSDDQISDLTEALLDGVPYYDWDPNAAGGKARVVQFVQHLTQLPEYNLM